MCLCVNVFKANLETDLLILITCALTVMFNPNPALRNNHTYEASLFSLPSLAHRLSVLKAVQRLTQYARLDVLLQLELRCVRRLVSALLDAQLHTTCQSVCAAAAFAPMP